MRVKDTLNLGKTKFPMRDGSRKRKRSEKRCGKKTRFMNNDKS